MSSETIIETRGLTKYYSDQLAVHQLALEVKKGEIFGFLGPNGAGKTTFVKMMLHFIQPTEGYLHILGNTPAKLDRALIGYLPEKISIQPFLTGREFLRYQARLIGLRKPDLENQVDRVLARVEMTDAAERRISNYSKGMVQRIGLANTLLGDRQLLILDEPNSGLDPLGIALVRDVMLELKKAGKTIFFNSHQLLEVEKVCDRVAILNHGRVVAQGTSKDLASKRGVRFELAEMNQAAEAWIKKQDAGAVIRSTHVEMSILDEEAERLIPAKLIENGARILSYNQSSESLEDVFHRLIGQSDADQKNN